MGLTDGLDSVIGAAKNVFSNPVGAAVGGAVVGSAVTGAVIAGVASRKTSRKKKYSKKSKSRKSKRKTKSYKYARTARKGKDTSHKRIRMTKNGQPYVIMASGKARFISKSSARRSRKTKGGRY